MGEASRHIRYVRLRKRDSAGLGTGRDAERSHFPALSSGQRFPLYELMEASQHPPGGMMTVARFPDEDIEFGMKQVLCPSLEVHQQQIQGSNLGPRPLNLHFCPLEAHYSKDGLEISSFGTIWKPVKSTESLAAQVHIKGCKALTCAFPGGNSDLGKSPGESIS